jgi:Helix-turn-helix domain
MGEPTPTTAPTGHQGWAVKAAAASASWRGVLRQDGRRVWSCRHHHDSVARARACAEQERLVPGASQLGLRLRELRRAAGLTMRRVAEELECSAAKLSRLENGQVRATPRDVRDMLALYGVTGPAQQALIHTARQARRLRRPDGKARPPDRGRTDPGR